MDNPARELEARVAARVGSEIKGKWRIERVLGTGGMAAVYAATHRNGKRVAIKVLHPEVTAVPDLRARFLREGYAANKVAHPNVVGVADDDVTDDGAAFLVMDRLDGETVGAAWLKKRRFEARAVLEIADQLLDVLVAAHGAGVVHRDLKPDNLFLTADGTLKVLDFGIARVRELSASTKGATYAGAVMGTPAFMPPEQARSRWADVDAQSDLWAVGATMFTLLAGRFVHDGETANEQLAQAITRPAPPVAKVVPDVPADVGAIVDRALMYEKKDRFHDAREMRAAVRAALSARDRLAPGAFVTAPTVAAVSSSGGETLLTSESASRANQPARARTIAIACGAAAAAIAIAVALLAGGGERPGNAAHPVAAETAASPPAAATAPSAPAPTVEAAPSSEPLVGDAGTTLDVDALPEASGAAKARGPRAPGTATEGGAKPKKRRNLGF